MEMNESQVLELIKSGKKIAVKVWMDDCPKCVDFAPIFEKVAAESKASGGISDYASFNLPSRPDPTTGSSVFKKEYMKPNEGQKSIGAPAVMVFNGGQLLYRHYGKMDEASLLAFIEKGEAPVDQKNLARQELFQLFARRGELSLLLEELPHIDNKIKEIKTFLGIK